MQWCRGPTRKLAVMAEIFTRRTHLPAHDREHLWVDREAAVLAELAAAQNITPDWPQAKPTAGSHYATASPTCSPCGCTVAARLAITDLMVNLPCSPHSSTTAPSWLGRGS